MSVFGMIAGWLVGVTIAGICAGIFWLLMFGDNPWPKWTNFFLSLWTPAITALCGIGLGGRFGYRYGSIKDKINLKSNQVFVYLFGTLMLIFGILTYLLFSYFGNPYNDPKMIEKMKVGFTCTQGVDCPERKTVSETWSIIKNKLFVQVTR